MKEQDRLDLLSKDVDIVCVDCTNAVRAANSMRKSMSIAKFKSKTLFTSMLLDSTLKVLIEGPNNIMSVRLEPVYTDTIEVVKIEHVRDMWDYCFFVMVGLGEYFIRQCEHAGHVLVVQHDSWIVNPSAWTDEFLEYDYIGAPLVCHIGSRVQNGGFSLRSKKLCCTLAQMSMKMNDFQDDVSICHTYRNQLESAGIKFAPTELAEKFSCEGRPVKNTTFGQHACGNGVFAGWDYGAGYKRKVYVCPPTKVFPVPDEKNPETWAYQTRDALVLIDMEETAREYSDLRLTVPSFPALERRPPV